MTAYALNAARRGIGEQRLKSPATLLFLRRNQLFQRRNPLAGRRRNPDGSCRMNVLRQCLRAGKICLIVDRNDTVILQRLQFPQRLIDHRHLCVRLRRGRIDHMKDQIRIARLLKRRVKRLNQLVRQLPDKADRIRDEDFFAARQRKFSGGRV